LRRAAALVIQYLFSPLGSLGRQYDDYGSVARDRAEGNLNRLNFPEFHQPQLQESEEQEIRDEIAIKKDLFFIAEYERECLDLVVGKFECRIKAVHVWRLESQGFESFIRTVGLYRQIYATKNITNRVK
jgi:hypothetical protein